MKFMMTTTQQADQIEQLSACRERLIAHLAHSVPENFLAKTWPSTAIRLKTLNKEFISPAAHTRQLEDIHQTLSDLQSLLITNSTLFEKNLSPLLYSPEADDDDDSDLTDDSVMLNESIRIMYKSKIYLTQCQFTERSYILTLFKPMAEIIVGLEKSLSLAFIVDEAHLEKRDEPAAAFSEFEIPSISPSFI